jgi:predicted RNA-binding protein with PIN domain
MNVMPYLIDGHNLIPKLGLRLDSPDDEMELIGILQEFSRLSRRGSEVYFDGAPAGQAGIRKFGLVTAHFVRLSSSADSAIRSRLKKLGRAARNWIVVSSDHEVQHAATEYHAAVASSEEFAGQLKKIQRPGGKPLDEKVLTSEEVEEWLKLFNKKK